MFDIGLQELILIFVIALLVFGPKNLPQLGRSLGRAMREFRRASDEFRSTVETNLQINEPDPVPYKAPEPSVVEAAVGTGAAQALPESVLDPHAPVEVGMVVAPPGEAFVAQRGARLFHARDCGWVRGITEPERTYFKRPAEAKEAGFQACPSCEPWEPS
ncbi:MAG TPA: twin-arginine translocase TatA/TatE family subunit [Methylomirabilota bacterium]|nr:twin-arginine translocase TatA/TatE family subunit [Methylomirabilota bacterium]